MVQIQPSFRVKLTCVPSPQGLGLVDPNDRNADGSALGDKDAVDELAGGSADGVREWYCVVSMDLRKRKMKRCSKESAEHDCSHSYSARAHRGVS